MVPEREDSLSNGEALGRLLCLLEPGMTLTVPDEWLDRAVSGSLAQRVSRIEKIAMDYGCAWHQGLDRQTFEKQELPATG